MNFEEFEYHLDVHGVKWQNWPESIRSAAFTLAEKDQRAKNLYEAEMELDSMLASARLRAPVSLQRRILNQTIRSSQSNTGWLDTVLIHVWRPIAVALVPLVLGLGLGFFDQDPVDDLEEEFVVLTFTEMDMLAGVSRAP